MIVFLIILSMLLFGLCLLILMSISAKDRKIEELEYVVTHPEASTKDVVEHFKSSSSRKGE